MSSQGQDDCQTRWHDELAAYALGALPGAEATELEGHLAECASCTERLQWLRPAVDLVPASVPQLEPPPELGQRLMAIVEAEAEPEVEPAPAPAREERRRRGLRLPSFSFAGLRPAMAGLAVLAVLFAGVGGYLLAGGTGDDGSAESFAVKPLSPDLAASGEVQIADGKGTLTVDNLPAIPDDEVYQVWTSNGEDVNPSSIFVAETGGHATAAIPEIPADTNRVLITREPAGGSEVASTDAVLAATLD